MEDSISRPADNVEAEIICQMKFATNIRFLLLDEITEATKTCHRAIIQHSALRQGHFRSRKSFRFKFECLLNTSVHSQPVWHLQEEYKHHWFLFQFCDSDLAPISQFPSQLPILKSRTSTPRLKPPSTITTTTSSQKALKVQ